MPTANDIYGTVFERGSAVLLARLAYADGQLLTSTGIDSIHYTVYEVDACDAETVTSVAGHDMVPLSAGAVLFGSLQTGGPWSVDATGYNFRHDLNVAADAAFPSAGKDYQIRYEVTPAVGQVIVFRFHVRAI